MFEDKMVTPAIPERVYTLCKIIEKQPLSLTELKNKMEPDYLNQTSTYFNDYKNAAQELKLITISDTMVSLSVDPSVIETSASMRRYINSMIKEFKTGHFYQVTKYYYNLNADVLTGEQNVATLGSKIQQDIGLNIDAPAMRAWRFWVSYLGFGYLHDMFLIPNANVFLLDIINIVGFEKNKRYSFGEFIQKLMPYSSVIIENNPNYKNINFGVSNGLRLLHDVGIIKLEHILDQEDMWNLYPLTAHEINSTVTNITICN